MQQSVNKSAKTLGSAPEAQGLIGLRCTVPPPLQKKTPLSSAAIILIPVLTNESARFRGKDSSATSIRRPFGPFKLPR